MALKKTALRASVPAILAATGLSVYAQFMSEVPRFSVFAHVFRLRVPALLASAALFGLTLFAFEVLYARIASRRLAVPFEEVLRRDAWTLLPLAFTALAPITLTRYIGTADVAVRSRLLLAAAVVLVIYLKAVRFRGWQRASPGTGPASASVLSRLALRKKLAGLFVASLVAFNLGAALMLKEGVSFSGDEPHYLLMTRSLLHEGDLDLADNYARRDYTDYMTKTVTIPQLHVVTGRKPGTAYSFHSPGTAFMMLPFYAAGSMLGKTGLILLLKFGMSLFGALFVLQVFLFARDAWSDERLAIALTALVALATPVYFYSVHVYPELIVGAFAFLVFRLLRSPDRLTGKRLFLCGFLVSTFIWFHALKYIFLAGPLVVWALWVLRRKRSRGRDYALFLVLPVVITAAYLVFQKAVYGSYSLSAVSWKGSLGAGETLSYVKELITGIPFRFRWETLAGYFFDQKDGLFFYAPVYAFAFLGFVEMSRRKAGDLLELVFVAAPYVLVSAFLTQRTGYAPQARPLVAVIWALAIGMGWFLARNRRRVFAGAFALATFASLLMTGLLLRNPLCLYQETTMGTPEKGGGIFYILSSLHLNLPDLLPAYIKSREGSWAPNFIWLAIFTAFIIVYAVARRRDERLWFPWRAHTVFAAVGGTVFFFAFVLNPRTVLFSPERMAIAPGTPLTFYSMSRVVRKPEPGRFLLPDDDRAYVFAFSSFRKLGRLRVEFGSETADSPVKLDYFDAPVFDGRTTRETRTLDLTALPAYVYKNGWLYFVTIRLGNTSGGVSAETPYLFKLMPELSP